MEGGCPGDLGHLTGGMRDTILGMALTIKGLAYSAERVSHSFTVPIR